MQNKLAEVAQKYDTVSFYVTESQTRVPTVIAHYLNGYQEVSMSFHLFLLIFFTVVKGEAGFYISLHLQWIIFRRFESRSRVVQRVCGRFIFEY